MIKKSRRVGRSKNKYNNRVGNTKKKSKKQKIKHINIYETEDVRPWKVEDIYGKIAFGFYYLGEALESVLIDKRINPLYKDITQVILHLQGLNNEDQTTYIIKL